MKNIEMFHVKQELVGISMFFHSNIMLEYYSKGERLCYLILMPT